jgi:hypothetical protein
MSDDTNPTTPATAGRRGRGRPRIHADRRAAAAAAARAYRARLKAQRESRERALLHSDIIDLSALPPWRRV